MQPITSNSSSIETFYQRIISACSLRISELTNTEFSGPSSVSFSLDFSSNNFSDDNLTQAIGQLNSCWDKDLLIALRDQFSRTLRTHQIQMAPQPVPQLPSPTAEHNYFLNCNAENQNSLKIVKYYHFDGQGIARELVVEGDPPVAQLFLTGRDDTKMCQWNLEEAQIAEDLGDKITEKEFNEAWFKHGGYPYVRPNRKLRRFLTSALVKKS